MFFSSSFSSSYSAFPTHFSNSGNRADRIVYICCPQGRIVSSDTRNLISFCCFRTDIWTWRWSPCHLTKNLFRVLTCMWALQLIVGNVCSEMYRFFKKNMKQNKHHLIPFFPELFSVSLYLLNSESYDSLNETIHRECTVRAVFPLLPAHQAPRSHFRSHRLGREGKVGEGRRAASCSLCKDYDCPWCRMHISF